VDTDYRGGPANFEFVPATKVAYKASERFAYALEEYADLGTLRHLASGSDQAHQIYGVVDYTGKKFEIEAGLGFGLTRSADDLVGKLIIAFDLN
jgi:hypothetical protein